jgi:hypothetical protein
MKVIEAIIGLIPVIAVLLGVACFTQVPEYVRSRLKDEIILERNLN